MRNKNFHDTERSCRGLWCKGSAWRFGSLFVKEQLADGQLEHGEAHAEADCAIHRLNRISRVLIMCLADDPLLARPINAKLPQLP
jgi:hypothetical protein